MKYKEFREYLKGTDFELIEDEDWLIADSYIEISKVEEYSIIFSAAFVEFPREFEMLKKAIELAETPLDEREEEKNII